MERKVLTAWFQATLVKMGQNNMFTILCFFQAVSMKTLDHHTSQDKLGERDQILALFATVM